jgi:hypothetical protein
MHKCYRSITARKLERRRRHNATSGELRERDGT